MNSPDQPLKPEQIAAKLTKAQREALLALSEKLTAPRKAGLTTQRVMPLMDLWRSKRGILSPIQLVRRDYSHWPRLHWQYALTPLGRAVKAHLQSKEVA